MSNIVLTSNNRILGLPVKCKELLHGEKIVATNADLGMLYVDESSGEEVLVEYCVIDLNNLPKGSAICLPSIDDYKKEQIAILKNKLKEFEEIHS